MSIQSQRELEAAREKLRTLEESYQAAAQDAAGGRHVQELELRSLKKLINQLKEEIARFEGRSIVRSKK